MHLSKISLSAGLIALLSLSACFKKYDNKTSDVSRSTYNDEDYVNFLEFPSCKITSANHGWVTQDTFNLNFECFPAIKDSSDLVEKVECQKSNDLIWHECSSRYLNVFTNLDEGINTLRIRPVSRKEKVGPARSLQIRVDTIKPSIELLAYDGIINSVARLSFSPSDDASGSGINRVLCQVYEKNTAPAPWYACGGAATYRADLLGLANGKTYVFNVKAEDNAGNTSPTSSLEFLTNFSPPSELCTISPVTSPTQLTTVNFNFSCVSAQTIARVECRIDSSPWQQCSSTTSHTYSSLTNGQHKFQVRYINTHDLASPVSERSFVVDTNPPELSITNASLMGLSSLFVFTVDDDVGVARVECSIAPKTATPIFESCHQNYYKDNLSSGVEYMFVVRAYDLAGNIGIKNYEWTTSPPSGLPVCSILSNFPNGYSTASNSTVSFSCSSPHGNVQFPECRVNDGLWGDCSSVSSHIIPSASDGDDIQFCVKTNDVWNRTSPPSCLTWKISTKAPVMNSNVVDVSHPYARLFFGASPSSCPIARYECRLVAPSMGHSWKSCESPMLYSGLTLNQDHTFYARAVTECGQVSGAKSISWKSVVSNQGPVCELLTDADLSVWHSSSPVLAHISCEDSSAVLSYQCSDNGSDWTECLSPLSISANSTGEHTKYVRGVGDLGALGPVSQKTIKFDFSNPNISVSGLQWNNDLEIFMNASDVGSGIEKIECRVESHSSWENCSSPVKYDWSLLRDAGVSFKFQARAKDRAGRYSAIAEHSWTNGKWSDYGECVRQPDNTGKKTRSCNSPSPSNGGLSCQGVAELSCTPPPLPTCENGASNHPTCSQCPSGSDFALDGKCKPIATNQGWSAWSACSVSCGGGFQLRDCIQPQETHSQSSCTTASVGQARYCNLQPCCLASGTYLGVGDVPGYSQSEVTCHSSAQPPPVIVDDSSLGCCSAKVIYSDPQSKTAITCGPNTNCSFCTQYIPGVNQPNYNWDDWKLHCQ